MDDIRRLTKQFMGANLVEPTASPAVVRKGQNVDVSVRSRVMRDQSWTLTISRWCDGTVVRRFSGTARPGDPIRVQWAGRDSNGNPAPPGRYRLRLSSSGGGTTAWPWARGVSIGVGGSARDASGSSMTAAGGGTYVPVKPTVIADTTSGKGVHRAVLLGSGARADVPVLGRAGVPSSGVSAVALSVLASCPSADTSVTVAPGGLAVGGSRVVTVDRNGAARGLTFARVSPRGDVTLKNRKGFVAVSVAVVGYVSKSGNGGRLVALTRRGLPGARPVRLDTGGVNVQVGGRAGVPNDARAVMLNVRRTGASGVSQIWAWPAGGERPAPSNWRRGRGSAAANTVIVPIGAGGQVRLAGDRAGAVALDVVGYVAASREQTFHPVVPRRLSREGLRIGKGDSFTLNVRGRAGVPTSARSVAVQLTGLNPGSRAQLTAWPRGTKRPGAADLYIPKHRERDVFSIIRIGDKGDIRLHSGKSAAGARVVVLGWVGS